MKYTWVGGIMDGCPAIISDDDEAIILMAMKQELARSLKGRFRLESALDAQSAIDLVDELYAKDVRVVLVLTDWLMPGMKGDELVAIIKRKHPNTRCILVSGKVDEKAVAAAMRENGLDAYVQKPWNKERLLEAVLRCVDA
jgi:response regulator RpfG family c-di-GMP phosphodiesterase